MRTLEQINSELDFVLEMRNDYRKAITETTHRVEVLKDAVKLLLKNNEREAIPALSQMINTEEESLRNSERNLNYYLGKTAALRWMIDEEQENKTEQN